MFDDFLRARAARTGEPYVPFDPAADYNSYVDGRPRADGVRTFLASRGITLPDGAPGRPARRRETVHGLGNRKNELLLRLHPRAGRAGLPGLGAPTCAAARDAGLRRAVVSASANCREVLAAAGPGPTCSRYGSTASSRPSSSLRGKPAPGHASWPRRRRSGVAPDRARRVRGRRRRGRGRSGRRLRLRGRASTGSATPTTLRRRRRRPLWSRDLAELLCMDESVSRTYPVEPWRVRETRARPGPAGPVRVGLRALQRPHRTAGQPRRGRAARAARHLPQLVLRAAAAALRRGRLRLPRVRARPSSTSPTASSIRLLVDDEPFDVRYGELRSHERVLDLRAGTLERDGASGARRPARRSGCARIRLVSFTQRSIAAIHYEVEPVDEPARLIVQSELVANEELPPTERRPAGRRRAGRRRWRPRSTISDEPRALLVHRTTAQRAADGRRRWTTSSTAPSAPRVDTEAHPDWARTTVACVLQPGRAAAGGQVPRRTAGRRSGPGRPCATRCTRRWPAARFAGWDGLLQAQRGVPRRVLGRAPTSQVEGDPEVQQAVRFGLFHVLQAGARAEQRPIAAKGLTGPGLRRARVLGHRDVRAAGAHLHRSRHAAGDALRWRHSTLDLARERARQLRPARAPPSRGGRSAARSARPTGRPAPPRSTSAPTSPTPPLRYLHATGDDGVRRATSALELLVETARLWRSLGHHDRHGAFHLDGVTGPDEYTALARRQHRTPT